MLATPEHLHIPDISPYVSHVPHKSPLHMGLSQNGGYVQRDPYRNRNLTTGTRKSRNLGKAHMMHAFYVVWATGHGKIGECVLVFQF